ncbi:hypothetical protein [Arenicella xantha]|uniref:Uncharacterized protein n=1 Tax=Arenicella xantha TaxID=644221 RepID=A0A395JEP1_9GAMM|nr:hypothetical protein [Arenicella xantha]RBP47002.1 hypothetical protein DFR28_1155 [Arenicella xantha]
MKKTVLNRYLRIGLFMNSIFVIASTYKLLFPNPPISKPIIVIWLGFGVVALALIIKGGLDNHSKKDTAVTSEKI